jgi:hypothetical protein
MNFIGSVTDSLALARATTAPDSTRPPWPGIRPRPSGGTREFSKLSRWQPWWTAAALSKT